ncbi:MAG: hypothetical protein WC389_15315 [Lutibacter sp.]|jgi:hypothetical protein
MNGKVELEPWELQDNDIIQITINELPENGGNTLPNFKHDKNVAKLAQCKLIKYLEDNCYEPKHHLPNEAPAPRLYCIYCIAKVSLSLNYLKSLE